MEATEHSLCSWQDSVACNIWWLCRNFFSSHPEENLQAKSEIQSPCQSHNSFATHVHGFAAKTITQAVLNSTCM